MTRFPRLMWCGALLVGTGMCAAQSYQSPNRLPSPSPAHRLRDLELLGTDIPRPAFGDTILGTNSEIRRSLLRYGMAVRADVVPIFSVNTLAAPVPADQQSYVGQRPYFKWGTAPVLTWDMRALHLKGAQFQINGGLEWSTWSKAAPIGATLNSLYIYKSFGEDRLEVKAGYFENHFEYVGLQTGGSLVTGAQGIYAVLPYEAGMGTFPEMMPALNVKWNAPHHLYLKGGLQRSTNPAGGQATIDQNPYGLRFQPKGLKWLTIGEAGYRQAAAIGRAWMWLRGGYMRNSTPYPNFVTGTKTPGNYCGYLLGDRQFTHNATGVAKDGVYLGASAMMVPASMNTYAQYYEGRIYDEGPFRSRPGDTASLIVTHSVYSHDKIKDLEAEGKSFWRTSNTVTGTYTARTGPGVYLSLGLGYEAGPADTPRVANALVLTISPSMFF